MISLGTCDAGCRPGNPASYFARFHEKGMASRHEFRGEGDGVWHPFSESSGDRVAALQAFLKAHGFFPFGKIDGLCGYRTASSVRLFQEYVRTIEGDDSIGAPDGVCGDLSQAHAKRWESDGIQADWNQFSSQKPQAEYRAWMKLLADIRTHYLANPTTLLRRVSDYRGATGSRGVEEWNFDPGRIHMIGIRRDASRPGKRANDDVFILLINGLVFKFFGTTDPGKSDNPRGAPFLVHGQHHYRFGWHKQGDRLRVYRALKPQRGGALVIRDADRNFALTASELEGSLENNGSINIHWGGRGVSNWSEGCQAICGAGYFNHHANLVDSRPFAARRYSELGTTVNNVRQTKGAYSVLVDLVTAFSDDDHVLDYVLIYEEDLKIDPDFGADMAARINRVMNQKLTF